MPTYEYKCDACGHLFEQFQSIMAKPLKKCPGCGKPKLKRLLGTGAGLIFKGSGFYQTDYRSEAYTKSAQGESSSSTSKPADKKETPATKPAETKTEAALKKSGKEQKSA